MSIAVSAVLGRPVALAPQFAPGAGGSDALVGIVQEIVKAACLLAMVRIVRDEFDDVLDGVVYGAAIGAGFAGAETFAYALGGTGSLDGGSIGALLVAGLNQAFYRAVFGAVAGYASTVSQPWTARIVLVYGVATAALLHALHDTLPSILAHLVGRPDAAAGFLTRAVAEGINVLGMGACTIAVVIWAAWRREGRVVRARLADEVTSGVLAPDDLATIGSIRARVARQVRAYRSGGIGALRAVRQLYATAGELAFQKERLAVRRRVRPAESRTDELRAEILRLRRSMGETA